MHSKSQPSTSTPESTSEESNDPIQHPQPSKLSLFKSPFKSSSKKKEHPPLPPALQKQIEEMEARNEAHNAELRAQGRKPNGDKEGKFIDFGKAVEAVTGAIAHAT